MGGSGMQSMMMGSTTQQMMGSRGMGMMGQGTGRGRMVREQKLEEVEKAKADQNTQFAEELYTGRMVLVQAAFPAKEQLELFRVALRKASLAEMVPLIDTDEFRFVNLDIQRRELSPDGQPVSDWEDYDKQMKAELTRLLGVALDVDPPDQELVDNAMIPRHGLCWPLPKLELPYRESDESRYPRPTEIASIKDSLDKLRKLAQETNQRPPSELLNRIKGDVDVLDPFGSMKTEQDSASQEQAKPPAEGEKNPNGELEPVLPENVLVRFADLTVMPGHTYQYRVKVRAANPNYKKKTNLAYASLAKAPDLVANDWAEVPPVKVPYDVNWYAMDKRLDSDHRATLQIQRWLDRWEAETPKERRVGDWVVWDNARFYRGEYIGRSSPVAVPAWSIEKDDFEIAAENPSKASLASKVPVDFTVRHGNARSPALLVDVAGGRLEERVGTRSIKEDTPIQVLVLNPDGRLEMRSTLDDLEDKDRTARFDAYKKRIRDIQQGGGTRRQSLPGMNNLPGGDLFNKGKR
jgi:hypothetical protein